MCVCPPGFAGDDCDRCSDPHTVLPGCSEPDTFEVLDCFYGYRRGTYTWDPNYTTEPVQSGAYVLCFYEDCSWRTVFYPGLASWTRLGYAISDLVGSETATGPSSQGSPCGHYTGAWGGPFNVINCSYGR